MPKKYNSRNKKNENVSSEVVKGEDRPVLRVIRDYFDEDMKRIDDADQVAWVKITTFDPMVFRLKQEF